MFSKVLNNILYLPVLAAAFTKKEFIDSFLIGSNLQTAIGVFVLYRLSLKKTTEKFFLIDCSDWRWHPEHFYILCEEFLRSRYLFKVPMYVFFKVFAVWAQCQFWNSPWARILQTAVPFVCVRLKDTYKYFPTSCIFKHLRNVKVFLIFKNKASERKATDQNRWEVK